MSKDLIKLPKVLYGSEDTKITLNGISIDCYVLDNGLRVLSQRGLLRALGMSEGGGTGGAQRIVQFAQSKTINPFISKELMARIETPIKFLIPSAGEAFGYDAMILVDICDSIIESRKNGKLLKQQAHIADRAEALIRSFAKIGLIALIDEATGYQYERENDALQKILKELIADEITTPRRDTFPLSFYKEIFRLWNIPFTAQNIARKPQFIGHITNRFVYMNMPAGSYVLDTLKKKTPKTDAGNYKFKFHQSLTKEKGWELLKKVIYSVEALASISETKEKFKHWINEKYGQKSLFSVDELDRLSKENDEPKAIENKPKEKLSDFNSKLQIALNHNPKNQE